MRKKIERGAQRSVRERRSLSLATFPIVLKGRKSRRIGTEGERRSKKRLPPLRRLFSRKKEVPHEGEEGLNPEREKKLLSTQEPNKRNASIADKRKDG